MRSTQAVANVNKSWMSGICEIVNSALLQIWLLIVSLSYITTLQFLSPDNLLFNFFFVQTTSLFWVWKYHLVLFPEGIYFCSSLNPIPLLYSFICITSIFSQTAYTRFSPPYPDGDSKSQFYSYHNLQGYQTEAV